MQKEINSLKDLMRKIKELTEVIRTSEELLIRIISLVGWILILIKLFD